MRKLIYFLFSILFMEFDKNLFTQTFYLKLSMHDLYNFYNKPQGYLHVDTKYIKIFMIYLFNLFILYDLICAICICSYLKISCILSP